MVGQRLGRHRPTGVTVASAHRQAALDWRPASLRYSAPMLVSRGSDRTTCAMLATQALALRVLRY